MSLTHKFDVETKDDNIYYNISIVNNGLTSLPASFTQQLTNSILDNPADYYLSVARFAITGTAIPMFFFEFDTYFVTLQYDTFSYSAPCLFIPPEPIGDPLYASIFSYSEFLKSINNAYIVVFNNLNALVPGGLPIGSTPPYMIYNPTNGIISLYANGLYYDDENSALPIKVWMNAVLYRFFDNFYNDFVSENSGTNMDVRIRIVNFHDTNTSILDPSIPTNFYKMSQEGSNNSRFWKPNSILFKTTRIGTRPEYIQGANNTNQLIAGSNSGAGLPFDTIMTDFIPTFNSTEQIGWRQDLVYNAPFYRLVDLLGNSSNVIDLSIVWADQKGNQFPLLIEGGRSASVKLAFLKKSLYKNYKKSQEK